VRCCLYACYVNPKALDRKPSRHKGA
jgi:hypothetical protein